MTKTLERPAGTGGLPRRALLVLNPKSRSGGNDFGTAAARLRAGGIDLVDACCDKAKDLSPCIRAHRDAVDCVIVGGGDGSINAACQGLIDSGLSLGIIPLGTANDFARSAGIPPDGVAAARVIVEGYSRKVDIGLVNGLPFINVASVGLAADLAKSITREGKRRFGRLSYAMSAVKVLAQAKPFHATLIVGDEEVMVRSLQIAVGNGRFYGGGNVIDSEAQIDDGFLHLYSLEFSRIWRMALMARSFKAGSHGSIREVRTARGVNFEVLTRKPRSVNADGELLTKTPAVFTQMPRALRVFMPESCPLRDAAG